uniref:Uncharacterized protein n=1 Tax=Dicentrarchus labrax TaxID=13489 RepID=A0A8C4EL19_DICLA
KRLRQLAEIQLQCSSNGVYVHLPHHDRHVLVICSLQSLDVSRDARHSVDSHLLHPSALNLLHTLSHNEGNLGALSSILWNLFLFVKTGLAKKNYT